MTDETKTPEAGRALDLRIALEVMEQEARAYHYGAGVRSVHPELRDGPFFRACPRYSTDIADAMLVVGAIRQRISGRLCMDVFSNGHAEVSFTLNDDREGRGKGETLALAICRAALSAVVLP